MRKYSLNHGYTCPDIDSSIADAKDVLRDYMVDVLVELNPLVEGCLNSPHIKQWLDDTVKSFYSGLEDVFEGVRSTNEELRSSAEHQIVELVSELEEAEATIQQLESELNV